MDLHLFTFNRVEMYTGSCVCIGSSVYAFFFPSLATSPLSLCSGSVTIQGEHAPKQKSAGSCNAVPVLCSARVSTLGCVIKHNTT